MRISLPEISVRASVNQISVADGALDISKSQEPDVEETLDPWEEWMMLESKAGSMSTP